MGQLINPLSFRLNKNKFWIIRWSTFLKNSFKYILKDDFLIFSFLNFLFYKLKKLLKKKFFFLIIDFIVLKKNNIYFFLIDYLFLNKFYKKYFKKLKKKKLVFKNLKKIKIKNLINKILIFNFFKIFRNLKKKKSIYRKFKMDLYKNLKKIKIKKLKKNKRKNLLKKYTVIKKNVITSRNLIKKFFLLFFCKKFNFNLIFLILIYLIFFKKKLNKIFINNSFFIFNFLKSFLILNIKKFLKNNLSLNICYKFIIKLKNIENFFLFKNFKKKKKFILKKINKNKLLNKKNYLFILKKKRFFFNIKDKLKIFSKKKKLKKKKLFILKKNLLELPNQKINTRKNFFFKINNFFKKKKILKMYSKINRLKKFILKKNKNKRIKVKKKKKLNKTLKKKRNFFFLLNFNLKIFSIYFKFLFKKYRYNTNKILKLLENSLISFIKNKTFIKGFKIKIKGRFTQKSRSSLSIKNIGKYSLSKINNKIIYFEENISTIYGISSFKLFFLIDNNFFYKKNNLTKMLLNQF